jgi:hypothetical protein
MECSKGTVEASTNPNAERNAMLESLGGRHETERYNNPNLMIWFNGPHPDTGEHADLNPGVGKLAINVGPPPVFEDRSPTRGDRISIRTGDSWEPGYRATSCPITLSDRGVSTHFIFVCTEDAWNRLCQNAPCYGAIAKPLDDVILETGEGE